jgi:hypothetical protein
MKAREKMIEFIRKNNDVNGNPRYVCHFLNLFTDKERKDYIFSPGLSEMYKIAVKRANKIGGSKYHNKQYGGGIIFQSYNIEETEKDIIRIREQS